MKIGKVEIKLIKNSIPTDNLYIALIGKIDAEPVSENMYINNGEYLSHYTAVIKNNNQNYNDVFDNTEYDFRNERQNATILTMYSFIKTSSTVKLRDLKTELMELNIKLGENKLKKGDKKQYVRTRK